MPVMSALFLDTSSKDLMVSRELIEASGWIGLTHPLTSVDNGVKGAT